MKIEKRQVRTDKQKILHRELQLLSLTRLIFCNDKECEDKNLYSNGLEIYS